MALVLGASGGIGSAICSQLLEDRSFSAVLTCSRSSGVPLDLCCESSIKSIATDVAQRGCDLRLVIDATGVLEGDGCIAEKSWRQIDAAAMARAFAVNAIGPALLIKNFLPLLPREGKSVFATLSARVGSISDNRLGGWYSYRASKAALNQIVRTAVDTAQPGSIILMHDGGGDRAATVAASIAVMPNATDRPSVGRRDILTSSLCVHAGRTAAFQPPPREPVLTLPGAQPHRDRAQHLGLAHGAIAHLDRVDGVVDVAAEEIGGVDDVRVGEDVAPGGGGESSFVHGDGARRRGRVGWGTVPILPAVRRMRETGGARKTT